MITVAILLGLVLVPIVMTRRRGAHRANPNGSSINNSCPVAQSLGAIKDVKVTGRQPFFEERFRLVKRELGATKQRRAWAARWRGSASKPRSFLSMLLVVFW